MKKTILLAAVMFLAFSVAAFAQAQFQVGSTPITTVASCGTAELTGDISFTRASTVLNATTGTITISYGVPITNIASLTMTTVPVAGLVTNVSTAADLAAGRFVLGVAPAGNTIDAILLAGIRVNVAGNPTLTNLTATITATGNTILGGQTSVVVVSSIASAIASIDTNNTAVPPVSTALKVNAVSPAFTGVTVNVTEGFLGAWNQLGQQLRFTPSAIPTGTTLTFPASFTTNGGTVFTRTGGGVTLPAPFVTSVNYAITTVGSLAPVTLDVATFTVTPGLATVPAPPSPLPQGSLSLTVDMGPRLGPAPDFPGSVAPQYTGTTCQRGPATIYTIITANTKLLIPYAVFTGPTGYDTGIAIANTTKDPAADAVPQNGTITFNFYPQTGDPFTYATVATSPGSGLNAGVLESGRLYAVLLSQLLTAAGKASTYTFSGYVIAEVNATNCHGQYFISDFEAFTNGALMLVLNPATRNVAPEALDN